jgi:hydroxyacylglutathione hydrolase
MISIINISQLQDNYSYAILNNKEVIIIDPADSVSILRYISNNQLSLKAILLTHHHTDHTAGIEGILNKIKVPVYSPNKKIKYTTIIVKDQDTIDLNFIKIEVIATPGHTLDHVVFYSKENNILFSGDTLFRLGCGRIFEGTYQQMFKSLQKINKLDNITDVYCGHEYTNTNLKFLLNNFPKSEELLAEKNKINLQLQDKGSSIPFNLGNEKKLNPFLSPSLEYLNKLKIENNLSNFDIFSYLRELNNSF